MENIDVWKERKWWTLTNVYVHMFLMRAGICVMVTIILTPIYLVFKKPKSYNDTFSRDGKVVTRSVTDLWTIRNPKFWDFYSTVNKRDWDGKEEMVI